MRHPGVIDIPLSVKDALDLNNSYRKDWAKALRMEVKGIIDRRTLSGEYELPDGLLMKHLVIAKVAFDVKYGENMEKRPSVIRYGHLSTMLQRSY